MPPPSVILAAIDATRMAFLEQRPHDSWAE